jgi:hypothetical protein
LSLRRITEDLRSLLVERRRADLSEEALDRVGFTDDGTTIYVHVLPKTSWKRLSPGRAYVLAFADKVDLTTLADVRAMLCDARLLAHDDIDDIIRWFDGR